MVRRRDEHIVRPQAVNRRDLRAVGIRRHLVDIRREDGVRPPDDDRILVDRPDRRVHRLLAVAEAVEHIGDDGDIEFPLHEIEEVPVVLRP